MKIILLTLISLLTVSTLDAQKLYKQKKKRKDFFGKVESPNDGKVRPIGLQVQVAIQFNLQVSSAAYPVVNNPTYW